VSLLALGREHARRALARLNGDAGNCNTACAVAALLHTAAVAGFGKLMTKARDGACAVLHVVYASNLLHCCTVGDDAVLSAAHVVEGSVH
jgi:hypothetical protein